MKIGHFLMPAVLLLNACGSGVAPGVSQKTPGAESCTRKSWVAGSTELCGGRLIYRDYIYDDYGADTGAVAAAAPGTSSLSAVRGDQRYPADAVNTADLVRLELWLEGDDVQVEFELNTLFTSDQTLAALALDTDDNAGTGSETLLGLRVAGADQVHVFSDGDPDTNLIRGRFPRPQGRNWKLWAVTAQADGTVMNLAFRGTGETANTDSAYWDNMQAVALGSGDISEIFARVDVTELEQGVTRAAVSPSGFQQRVYTSAYTLPPGEGISAEGVPGRHGRTDSGCEQYFDYLGKYQPYGVYVPALPAPHGLTVVLHGCDANHSSQVRQDGFQADFGDGLNTVIVAPLGRGTTGWFSDISERDVLDVIEDALTQLPVDTDRVLMTGYSMGGYGAMRMAAFYPQLFAGVVTWVGNTGSLYNAPLPGNPVTSLERQLGAFYEETTGMQIASGDSGAIGDVLDFLGNLRHIPFASLYGTADYLVPVNTALALEQRLSGNPELEYDFYLHPAAEHLSFAVLDTWAKEARYMQDRRRVHQPAQIRYRADPVLHYPEYDIRHDRAYWASRLTARSEGVIELALDSAGCGGTQTEFLTGEDAGAEVPFPWIGTFRRISMQTARSPQNRLSGSLVNIASLEIDATAACLTAERIVYELVTDGASELRFSDGRRLHLESAGLHAGEF